MSATFKPGDHVVHAVHGPGQVVAVETRDTPSGPVEYVSLDVADMRVLIPTTELDEVGVRQPMTREDAKAILDMLGEDSAADPGHTARRRRNRARLNGGEASALAEVIRSLQALRADRDKGLALSDRNHLLDATSKLAGELAISLGVTEADARVLVDEALAHIAEDDTATDDAAGDDAAGDDAAGDDGATDGAAGDDPDASDA